MFIKRHVLLMSQRFQLLRTNNDMIYIILGIRLYPKRVPLSQYFWLVNQV